MKLPEARALDGSVTRARLRSAGRALHARRRYFTAVVVSSAALVIALDWASTIDSFVAAWSALGIWMLALPARTMRGN